MLGARTFAAIGSAGDDFIVHITWHVSLVCHVVCLQRDKQRMLAENVHEAKSRVSQQKDRWRVQFYTEAGARAVRSTAATRGYKTNWFGWLL